MGYFVDYDYTCWDIGGVGPLFYFCSVSMNHFKFLCGDVV